MFTIYDGELDSFARRVLDEQRAFERGHIDPEALHTLQLERLRQTVRYVQRGSPFYASRLGSLSESDVAGLNGDTFSALPFTTKDDLRRNLHGVLSRPIG